jgi:phosphoserine aminotransferase
MISFYPGPSKVFESVPQFLSEAYEKGVLSINHRSPEFVKISEKAVFLLKQKLNIPQDYTIFFTSSATECWEIIAQSLIEKKSLHVFNGAFGEKWHAYTKKLHKEAASFKFGLEELLRPEALPVESETEMICLTHNETSNGTQLSDEILAKTKELYSDKLIAIDATSSMAGLQLDFKQADVWYASVQKCFGLPAGLAVMVCSPKAVERANTIGENSHYNSLCFMIDKMKQYQTTYTPNVLNIYLLMRTMEERPNIIKTEDKLLKRYDKWMEFLQNFYSFRPLIKNAEVRSNTVLALKATPETVEVLKTKALLEGMLIGNGYGSWHAETFRIANFPALRKKEIKKLMAFLKKNYQ